MKIDLVYKYGFFVLLVLVILVYIFKGQGSDGRDYEKELEAQKEMYEKRIRALEDSVRVKDKTIARIRVELEEEKEVSADAVKRRKQAIQYYEKRIRDRNKLTTHELDSIFADRYRLGGSSAEVDSR